MIRPPKSVLLQYIYDYGLDKAAALFHIDTETADKIINWKPQYDQYYNPQIEMFAHFKTKSSFHKTKRII